MALHYVDGCPVTEKRALAFLREEAARRGYEPENWETAWKRRQRSEEARELLGEITGYQLEIEV